MNIILNKKEILKIDFSNHKARNKPTFSGNNVQETTSENVYIG